MLLYNSHNVSAQKLLRHSRHVLGAVCFMLIASDQSVRAQKAEPFGQENVETRPLRHPGAAGAAKAGAHQHGAKGHQHKGHNHKGHQRKPHGGHQHGPGKSKAHTHEGAAHAHHHGNPAAAPAHMGDEHGVETGHIFGFLMGSDTHPKGQIVLEAESLARFGRMDDYTVISKKIALNYAITNDVTVAGGFLLGYYNVRNFPDPATPSLEQGARFDGLGFELRWRLLNRKDNPVGVTLLFEPAYALSDDNTGRRGNRLASENRVIIDRELVHDKLFGTLNLNYDIDYGRDVVDNVWATGSRLGAGFGLSYQVLDKVFLGAEMRYLRSYEGLAANRFRGDALYVGPTFFAEYKNMWASVAFATQVAGSDPSAPGMTVNLTQFERYQMRFRFGYEF